jgi:hypothetical protein
MRSACAVRRIPLEVDGCVAAGEDGGLEIDFSFFLEPDLRAHQVHLEGGDSSSDSLLSVTV